MPDTPYSQGYQSSMNHDGGTSEPCPYPEGSDEYTDWWKGFDAAMDDEDSEEPDV